MPKSLVAPSNIVINTYTHNLPGEHWLAVSYKKSGLIYAFDSFGLYYPTLLQNYLQRLKRRSGPVKYNRTQFQEVHEKTCGHYCIAYFTYINTWVCSVKLRKMSAVLFIDFEAFQHGDEDFKIKELCILDVTAPLKPLTFLFKPTKPWDALKSIQKRTYAYQEHNLHHLSWSEGNKSYCTSCLERHIKRAVPMYQSACCYVLG